MKKKIIITGPPVRFIGGVSTHIRELLSSDLSEVFDLQHLEIGMTVAGDNIAQRIIRTVVSNVSLYRLVRKSTGVHINASMDLKSLLRDTSLILISKLAGGRVFLQFHGGRIDQLRILRLPIASWLLKHILKLVTVIAVRSKEQKDSIQKLHPEIIPEVIPNFINAQNYVRNKTSSYKNKVTLLFVGRLAREKGIYELIKAFQSCVQDFPHSKLWIAGAGQELSSLRKLCKKLNLEGNVDLLGFITGDYKIRIYLESDIFVFPTYWPEGFPYVITEAMAAGLPIIASPCGAISEIIEDGVNGFLVPPKDPAALGKKLRLLLEDNALRRRMGKRNVEKVRADYDWDKGVELYTRIYKYLLNVNKP